MPKVEKLTKDAAVAAVEQMYNDLQGAIYLKPHEIETVRKLAVSFLMILV